MIALCTVLCGGESCVDMADFAEEKEAFLREFLSLEKGLPSHDTFSRVFRALEPEQFRRCFQAFMARFAETCQGVIAIDGKVLRRSFDTASAKSSLHMVSAWGCEQRLVLGQIATDAKSNEITAVPKLLEMLSLKGCIVTRATSAMRSTASATSPARSSIRACPGEGRGRRLCPGAQKPAPAKAGGNQGTLHDDVRTFLDDPATEAITVHATVDGDHGRIETRTATISTAIDWLQEHHHWPGLKAIGKIVRTRESGVKTTTETAYYLLSTPLSAERFGQVARAHWAVENNLHWTLDVVMNEDQARNRLDNGPNNLAVLRHMALNILNTLKSKISNRRKIKRAGWSNAFLTNLLAQI